MQMQKKFENIESILIKSVRWVDYQQFIIENIRDLYATLTSG